MVLGAGGGAGARRSSQISALRLALVGVGVASLVSGYLGLHQHLAGQARTIDILYYTVQLFVMGAPPLDDGGPYPPALEIARFTAPAVTFYAFFEAGRLLFAAEVARRRLRRAYDHVVVCGDGLLATTLTRRLLADGHHVINISASPAEWPGRRSRLLRVVGDARDPDVLRDANLPQASALYACTEDSAANTAIALAAGGQLGVDRPVAVYAHVADPDLCLALQARHRGRTTDRALRLDFFNIDDLAARDLAATHPLRPRPDHPPRVLVVGATVFGRAVIVEMARQWRVLARAEPAQKLSLTVVDPAAGKAIDDLRLRYPFLDQVCDLAGHVDLAAYFADEPTPPDRTFICYEDEQLALRTALTDDRMWQGTSESVVVRQDQLTSLQVALSGQADRNLFDEVSDTLVLFGVIDAGCDPRQIRNDLTERLARAIHESYLLSLRQSGTFNPDLPSARPWHALPEFYREDNRDQAADIGHKLRSIACVLAPRVSGGEEHKPTTEEIERLAMVEHARWLARRRSQGWRFGPQLDPDNLTHPALLPWRDLSEDYRARNRDIVQELPNILGDCGFRIVRRRQEPPQPGEPARGAESDRA